MLVKASALALDSNGDGRLTVRFIQSSPWVRSFETTVTPGSTLADVLYNVIPYTELEVYVEGKPYSLVNSGAPRTDGGSGLPSRGPAPYYAACNGRIVIDGSTTVGLVAGSVQRQYRSSHGGITLSVTAGGKTLTTTTNADGSFSILAPTGTAVVSASRPGYLSVQNSGVPVTMGATRTLPPVKLLAGELTGDACINTADLTLILNAIGSTAPGDDVRDITGNKVVSYDDLGLASFNGGLCGPSLWK